ncbi:MAG TPA: DUF362 domain-containing protein [Candidatus Sumerlaeota bacterium]|nr:MAG: hypothetical protein BWY12_00742 [candidate division BRC1 bacterium ADurb.Bin183]HOE63240.1 DUF362 domain-containing protein [Candidatus Sumerlaeota bacterium]HRU54210.1 DUF362 domain-containing protein [Candidatus Sumerlaeia bacterium]HON50598.1 DUF362 domain-containing protein [Candidatus Sumerlaeota bacterium]HOR65420.1 DUF362 domain-containing protein [Candidatus Sumerlaeota bacterium]
MKSKVAVLKTSPQSVVEDIGRLMRLADYQTFLPIDKDTLIKINISWHHYYPACSTSPWQYDGVVNALAQDGYNLKKIIPAHNRTVVVDAKLGIINNHFEAIDWKYGLRPVHLYENDPPINWQVYRPKGKFRVLDKVYPDGVKIPGFFFGKNIIQMPTVKTHVFTTITGAMKNAFGGLLSERRHWTHSVIHETLVDLLLIQKEIHTGIFAVMDGTIAGDGPGPRAMVPHVKNYILASADQVAIDAVSAKMQGFDPMTLDFIRCAHEDGLGVGDPREIEILGENISDVNFHFKGKQETFASRGQKMIYHGWLKPLEKILLRSPIVPWSYAASRLYYDAYWFNFIGKKRVKEIMKTEWGRLFQEYEFSHYKKTHKQHPAVHL